MPETGPKILVVGAGGRELALVRALKGSAAAPELLCAPGNPGIETEERVLPIAVGDVSGLADAAQSEGCDLHLGAYTQHAQNIVGRLEAEPRAAHTPR